MIRAAAIYDGGIASRFAAHIGEISEPFFFHPPNTFPGVLF